MFLKTDKQSAEAALDAAAERYADSIQAVATCLWEREIRPYLERRNIRFRTVNDDWWLEYGGECYYPISFHSGMEASDLLCVDDAGGKVYDLLSLVTVDGHPLAWYMPQRGGDSERTPQQETRQWVEVLAAVMVEAIRYDTSGVTEAMAFLRPLRRVLLLQNLTAEAPDLADDIDHRVMLDEVVEEIRQLRLISPLLHRSPDGDALLEALAAIPPLSTPDALVEWTHVWNE